jgi:HEAT repeat protein
MRHVLVSYAPEDADFAVILANRLEENGFPIWPDRDPRLKAEPRGDRDLGIREALGVVAVLSGASVPSFSTTYEWAFAIGSGVPVLPVLFGIAEADLHPRLRTLHYLDFSSNTTPPWEALTASLRKVQNAEKPFTVHVPRDAPPVIQKAARALDSLNEGERAKALETLGQIDHIAVAEILAEAIRHPVQQVRFEAAIQLAKYRDERAIPALLDGIRRRYERTGEWMLSSIGLPAVPALIEATRDENKEVQAAAYSQLGRIGGPEAIAALVEGLRDPDSTIRKWAAYGLIDAADAGAISALLGVVHDPEGDVRRAVIGALVKCGQKTGALGQVLPYLIEALDDEYEQVGINATEGLIESRDPLAVAALVRAALTNEAEQVRSFSRSAIAKLGQAAAPALREAASNPEARVRYRAINILGEMEKAAEPEFFLRAARDDDANVRRAAVSALSAFGTTAVPAVIERLHDSDQEVVYQAVVSLEQIGDLSCVPALIECLDRDDEAAERAASVLGSMDSRRARAAAHAWESENRR